MSEHSRDGADNWIIHPRRSRRFGNARYGRTGTHRVAASVTPGDQEGRPPIEIGIERILRERANFSYRNAVIAEVDGRVAAALLAYRLPEHSDVNLDELPDLLRPLEELEQKVPGTFYINILAAYPEYRGLGFGTTLLEAAHTLASEAGCNELSLEVFEENEDAVRLYERHGYREIARLPTVPHPIYKYEGNFVLMTRRVIGQSLIQNRD
jgi:ribosomal protein S18 acetylase RimI-like enzyme